MKKLLLLFAVLATAVTASAYDFKVDGLCYTITLEDNDHKKYECEVAPTTSEISPGMGSSGYQGDIVIPEKVTYKGKNYSVTRVGNFAFQKSEITSVVVPESVEVLGQNAFGECKELKTVVLSEGLVEIGNDCFMECKSLELINIPSTVRTLSLGCFGFCTNLKEIDIPKGITQIGGAAFCACYNLKNIHLPEGLKELDRGVFAECHSLRDLIIPSTLEYIGECCFYCCDFETLDLRNMKGKIDYQAFSGCDNLKTMHIPATVTLGDWVFDGCDNLTNVTFGEGFKTIPDKLFWGCHNMKSINLPKSLTKIGEDAFMPSLTSIFIDATEPPSIRSNSFQADPSEITVIVPTAEIEAKYRTADHWKKMTFANLESVVDITVQTPGDLSLEILDQFEIMPSKVVGLTIHGKINEEDFAQIRVNMKALMWLDLSDAEVTELPEGAFEGKASLQSVKLPRQLETIGDRAFKDCIGLTSVLPIPATVRSIGSEAFVNVPLNAQLTLPAGLERIGWNSFRNTGITGSLAIPAGITAIESYAFAETHIEAVELPASLTDIHDGVFCDCRQLRDINIPESVQYIGANALQGTSIQSIAFPEGVTEVNSYVLADCPELASVSIPSTVTSVRDGAFCNSSSLRNLSVKAETAPAVENNEVFRGVNTDLCIISIPTASYRQYVLSEYWGQFVQLRYDIAIETEGDGTIGYDNGDSPASAPRRAITRTAAHSPATTAGNGTTVYVPKNGRISFYLLPAEGQNIVSVTYNGEDVTAQLTDGIFTTIADRKNATLKVVFSDSSAIHGIYDTPTRRNAKAYNLAGMKVGPDYKGIVIQNGRKMFRR